MKALALPQFLGTHHLDLLTRELEACAQSRESRSVGCWDASTGFCVVVDVIDGTPMQWRVRGPLGLDDARGWLALFSDRPPVQTDGPTVTQ